MVMMPFTLLSGLATPISSMPWALQSCTLVNPLRYAIEMASGCTWRERGCSCSCPNLAAGRDRPGDPVAAAWMFRHRVA